MKKVVRKRIGPAADSARIERAIGTLEEYPGRKDFAAYIRARASEEGGVRFLDNLKRARSSAKMLHRRKIAGARVRVERLRQKPMFVDLDGGKIGGMVSYFPKGMHPTLKNLARARTIKGSNSSFAELESFISHNRKADFRRHVSQFLERLLVAKKEVEVKKKILSMIDSHTFLRALPTVEWIAFCSTWAVLKPQAQHLATKFRIALEKKAEKARATRSGRIVKKRAKQDAAKAIEAASAEKALQLKKR